MSQLQEFAEVIGEDAAMKLFDAFRGRRLHIPCRIPENHRLAVLLSHEVAKQLCFRFPAFDLDVPTGNGFARLTIAQRLRIRDLRNSGWSVYRIAEEMQLSRITVRKVLNFPMPNNGLVANNYEQLSFF